MRLANACEATANGLYSMAEVAANFANKVSGGSLPTSFNALRKKCAGTSGSEVALALGDLQWYRKVRELRTEWAHYSSIFMAEDEAGGTILCVRAYRRPSDKVEFKAEKFSCTIDDFIGWVRNALATLDRFAGFLLKRYVVTTFALDATFTSAVLDKNGFPIIKEDHRFTVETISIREYLKRGGIVVEG